MCGGVGGWVLGVQVTGETNSGSHKNYVASLVSQGIVPPKPLPLHPISYETGCVWVHQVLLPRTNSQKTEKHSAACFRMDSFVWRQPQRVQLSTTKAVVVDTACGRESVSLRGD